MSHEFGSQLGRLDFDEANRIDLERDDWTEQRAHLLGRVTSETRGEHGEPQFTIVEAVTEHARLHRLLRQFKANLRGSDLSQSAPLPPAYDEMLKGDYDTIAYHMLTKLNPNHPDADETLNMHRLDGREVLFLGSKTGLPRTMTALAVLAQRGVKGTGISYARPNIRATSASYLEGAMEDYATAVAARRATGGTFFVHTVRDVVEPIAGGSTPRPPHFDIILWENPPDWEDNLQFGVEADETLRERRVTQTAELLRPGGTLIMTGSPENTPDILAALRAFEVEGEGNPNNPNPEFKVRLFKTGPGNARSYAGIPDPDRFRRVGLVITKNLSLQEGIGAPAVNGYLYPYPKHELPM